MATNQSVREKPLILIVDDEKDFLNIFGTKLKASGFDVATAQSGDEGIKKANEVFPDLILMDVNMPGKRGGEVAMAIKDNPATKDVKIVFLTSLDKPWPALSGEGELISKELGMDGFLKKTDDLSVIVGRIKEILAK